MEEPEVPRAQEGEEDESLSRIEAELDAVRQMTVPSVGEGAKQSEFDELEERARRGKETLHKHTAEGQTGAFVGPEGGRSLGRGLQVAYAIIGVPIVGYGIGWLIDKQVGGVLWQGLLTIIGATIAVIYAARSASRD